MSSGTIGRLIAADEGFTHQIVDTFSTVLQSDYAWTEKVWGTLGAKDGSLQISFGFGKYTNRNVVDGYAGVSRNLEQWTVRASRELTSDMDSINVGPIKYEIVDPLHVIRVRLEKNDIHNISFDVTLTGALPCQLEEREDRRVLSGIRHSANQIRYHQMGTASGWVEVDGKRTEIKPDEWFMVRDRSWGVRPAVGNPLTDLQEENPDGDASSDILALWNPMLLEDKNGQLSGFFQYYLQYRSPQFKLEKLQGNKERNDATPIEITSLKPHLIFNPDNLRLLHGHYDNVFSDGSKSKLQFKKMGDTGFHLGAGLYLGFDGKNFGSWRGHLHVEGEYFKDCSTIENSQRLNQFRDCLVEVWDDEAGLKGWGILQSFIRGNWPEFNLTAKN